MFIGVVEHLRKWLLPVSYFLGGSEGAGLNLTSEAMFCDLSLRDISSLILRDISSEW